MTLRLRRVWPLFVVATVLAAFVVAPTAAFAAESLLWTRTYTGPDNIPNEPAEPRPVAGALNGVSFAGSTYGWAVGIKVDDAVPDGGGTKKGFIVSTRNGGSTWAVDSLVATREINAVDALSATDVWAVGNYGGIYHWDGNTWTTMSVDGWPAAKHFYGVAFIDSSHGWAVGEGMGVVRTTDGGANWSVVTTSSVGYALRAVAAANTTSALAVGDAGRMVLLTGASHTDVASTGTGAALNGVAFADPKHAWAVGDGATVVKSSDGGRTWSAATRALPGGYTQSDLPMRSVAFAGPYDGVIVGAYQMVWRTSDSGATWVPEQLVDLANPFNTGGDYELRGAAFAGTATHPVVAARPFGGALGLRSDVSKAAVWSGSWTGLTLPAPFAPSDAALGDGGEPRPSIRIAWADGSSDEDGFRIERRLGASGTWSLVSEVPTDTVSFVDGSVDWTSAYYYRVRSFRGALSSAWAQAGPFTVDAVAPNTTSNALRAYTSSATIDFVAADNAGGSGVAHTYSTVDGAEQAEGSSRVVELFGTHRLRFWSVDVAGNIEAAHAVDFYVTDPSAPDTTAPTTVSDRLPYYATSALVSLSATDNAGGSGVAHTYWRVDGGARTESSSARVTGSGIHTLSFWSEDVVGNVESTHSVTFTILSVPSSKGTPSTPSTPSSVKHGVAFTTFGYVIRHPAGTAPILLQFYRYQSGHWVLRKSAAAAVSNMLTFSKYSRSTSVPYAGKWRVRARHTVNGKYVYSGYRGFTAR